jgi:hypothetical protein
MSLHTLYPYIHYILTYIISLYACGESTITDEGIKHSVQSLKRFTHHNLLQQICDMNIVELNKVYIVLLFMSLYNNIVFQHLIFTNSLIQ